MQPNVIVVEQGTEEWHAARLGRATASRFKDVMLKIRSGEAAGRKNYRFELVSERLTGERQEMFTSAAMQWGTETEPVARLKYELSSGNDVEECGFFAHPELMAGASPDGLIGDDGILEIKCPNTATHIETLRKRNVPSTYYWQVQGQLWITGRKWCDFVSFDPRLPENAQFFTVRVERNEQDIKGLESEVTEFLKEVETEINFINNFER
jgi:putative phage-type endonuclease